MPDVRSRLRHQRRPLRRLPGLHARLPHLRHPRAARQGRRAVGAVHRLRLLPGRLPARRHRGDDRQSRGHRVALRVQGGGALAGPVRAVPRRDPRRSHRAGPARRRLRCGLGLRGRARARRAGDGRLPRCLGRAAPRDQHDVPGDRAAHPGLVPAHDRAARPAAAAAGDRGTRHQAAVRATSSACRPTKSRPST